jgi:plasmid stabilization system protein ParE
MKPWDIHPEAQQELEDAFEYYLVIGEDLAQSFDEYYTSYRKEICEHPLRYNLRRPPTRRVNLTPRFGEYYIAYMIWREKIVILAIAHAKRRPYYWRKRIGEAKKQF